MKPRSSAHRLQFFAGVATTIFGLSAGTIAMSAYAARRGPPEVVRVVKAGDRFTCTPTAVWDGDGPIWCAEGPRIRLAGIAAREIDGTCKPNHPCPNASGVAARDHLVGLLGGRTGRASTGHIRVQSAPLRCRSDGSAGRSRTAAWCTHPKHGDLSVKMVRGGYAVRWERYWTR